MADLHHVALGAIDVRRVADFYHHAFGLSVMKEHRLEDGSLRSVWLKMGASVLMIERTKEERKRVDGVGAGAFLIAFSVTEQELNEAELRLELLGAPVEQRTEFTSYVRDPEGNRVAVSYYPL